MIGALIALYERAVGLYGFLVNVNAYHQPGVEAGKKAAAIVLELQSKLMSILKARTEPIALAELAIQANATDQIEAVYKIVRHLAANDRGVILIGDLAKPGSLSIVLKG
jgi:glucose-6-phosphate isomerase